LQGCDDFLGPLDVAKNLARDEFAGAKSSVSTVDGMQVMPVIGDAPMALQALRADACAQYPAVGQALGQTAVVTVQQHRGIRGERMNLQKTRLRHCLVLDLG